jgi:hypothetical protein
MRRVLLATLVLLGAATLGRTEYILIVVNLNAKAQENQGNTPGMGFPGGAMPGIAGAAGSGPRGGGAGPIGPMPGGGMGPRGGSGFGPPGGMNFPGMGGPSAPGQTAEGEEPEDLIFVVLEVESAETNYAKKFALGKDILFRHKWGTVRLVKKRPEYEVIFLEKTRNVPLRTVGRDFQTRFTEAFKESKPSADRVVKDVALWALEHGLTGQCEKTMDRLAETEKNHTAVKAYLDVKAALARPLSNTDVAGAWKSRMPGTYQVSQDDKHHYALIHPASLEDANAHLDRLERSMRNYYYWWALRGIALPVPTDRQVAVITEQPADFDRLKKHLTASPTLTDSFAARREGLAVFSQKRGDILYDKFDKAAEPLKKAGFDFKELIKGKGRLGVPRGVKEQVHGYRTTALVLRALEDEWEQTGTTHEVSRQLLFASKLLPPNVNAPEWIQFGMGSFFEAPLQSPWPTIGAASPYWLPRFKEFEKSKDPQKRYEATPYQTLVKVVTDAYFRHKVKVDEKPDEKPEERADRQRKAEETQLRKARASAWALTYYLAREERLLTRLQRYFKELSKQPRDVELDDKTLLGCFQRAFGDMDLNVLAARWISYIKNERLEASAVHDKIREVIAQMNRPAPTNPNAGMGPFPGGAMPGGAFPGGGFPPRGGRPGGGR